MKQHSSERTPHKWHKEIKAWADGAEIEIYYDAPFHDWCPIPSVPEWKQNQEYRIKPQPKDDLICKSCGQFLHEQQIKEPQYLYVWSTEIGIALTKPKDIVPRKYEYIGKIPLIVESNDD